MAPTRMPPGDYEKKLIRIPPELLKKLEAEAKRQHRSVTGQLIHILSESLDKIAAPAGAHTPTSP